MDRRIGKSTGHVDRHLTVGAAGKKTRDDGGGGGGRENSQHLLDVLSLPGTVPRILHGLPHFFFPADLGG